MIIPSGTYLILVLCILIGDYILSLIVETLNIKNISTRLPAEFDGFYDAVHYKRSQEYLRENTRFGLFSETISLVVTVAFILLGGFGFFDLLARRLFLFTTIGKSKDKTRIIKKIRYK